MAMEKQPFRLYRSLSGDSEQNSSQHFAKQAGTEFASGETTGKKNEDVCCSQNIQIPCSERLNRNLFFCAVLCNQMEIKQKKIMDPKSEFYALKIGVKNRFYICFDLRASAVWTG